MSVCVNVDCRSINFLTLAIIWTSFWSVSVSLCPPLLVSVLSFVVIDVVVAIVVVILVVMCNRELNKYTLWKRVYMWICAYNIYHWLRLALAFGCCYFPITIDVRFHAHTLFRLFIRWFFRSFFFCPSIYLSNYLVRSFFRSFLFIFIFFLQLIGLIQIVTTAEPYRQACMCEWVCSFQNSSLILFYSKWNQLFVIIWDRFDKHHYCWCTLFL